MNKNIYFEGLSLLKLPKFIFDSLLSRINLIFNLSRSNQSSVVKDYYKKYRYNENEVDIIDLSFGPYNSFVEDFSKLAFQKENLKILDLGSGGGTLLNFLNQEKIDYQKYVGVDLFISNNEKNRNNEKIEFVECDIEFLKLKDIKFDIIFACNSIVYCQNSNKVIDNAISYLSDDGVFCIIEPIRSLFWEVYFNSIRLNFSTKKELVNLMGNEFSLIYSSTLYLRRFINYDFFRISQMLVFQKKKLSCNFYLI